MLSLSRMIGKNKLSGWKEIGKVKPESSYMAEAMIVLPVFVTFMTVLLFFFRVLQVQQLVDNALVMTGRELSE